MRRLGDLISSCVLLATVLAAACARTTTLTGDDAERAVAEFYAWYVPLAHDSSDGGMHAVRDRPVLFLPSLVTALREDSVANAQSKGDVVGLDGDPFLNAQDPCDKYAPVNTASRSGVFLVAVRGSGGCAAHTTADVTVEVTPIQGRPVFTNFIYSSATRDNLVSTLADLAAARRSAKGGRG